MRQVALAGAVLPLAGTLPADLAPRVASAAEDGPVDSAPGAGTDRQSRGAGDPLQIILKQAPTGAAPHSARSSVDYLAAAPVLEPLMQCRTVR